MMTEKSRILEFLDQDRRTAHDPTVQRIDAEGVVRHVSLLGRKSRIEYSQHTLVSIASAIEREVQFFESLGHDFEWKVFDHDQPQGLVERLRRRGFQIGERESLLVFDLADHSEHSHKNIAHEIRKVERASDLKDYLAIVQQVWGKDPGQHGRELEVCLQARHEGPNIYVAYVANRPVSCGRLTYSTSSRVAALWGGATLPEFRGNGLYSSLVASRIAEARSLGMHYIFVDARSSSRPILEKLKFQFLEFTYPCEWQSKLCVQEVSIQNTTPTLF